MDRPPPDTPDRPLFQPSPRYAFSSVMLDSKVFVWGGMVNVVNPLSVSTVSSLELSGLWEESAVSGSPPPGPGDGAFCSVGSSLYHFGGTDGKDDYPDIHRLDPAVKEWRKLPVRTVSGKPVKRCGSGMVGLGNDRLVIVAGAVGGILHYTNDVFVYNMKTGEVLSMSQMQRMQ